jgi:hypothetical protein
MAMDWLWKSQEENAPKLPVTINQVEANIEGLFSVDGEILIAGDSNSNYLCIGRNKDRLMRSINILGTEEQSGPLRASLRSILPPRNVGLRCSCQRVR